MSEQKQFFVEITNIETREVASRMGPMSEHKADKCEIGALMRIDRDRYFVNVVEAPAGAA